jgi:hypothetical protein
MQEECVIRNVIQPPLQCGTFEQKLTIFYGHMVVGGIENVATFF